MSLFSMSWTVWGLLWIPLFLTALLVIFGIFYRWKAGKANLEHVIMDGKTVIITGASAGIGKEAARDLARRGAKVIMGCRNIPKASKVAEDIRATTGNENVFVKKVDTSSLASVRTFTNEILAEEQRIDVLILNAGIGGLDERCVTSDGFEYTLATNHFGHFLMTNILLGLVKKSNPSRIIFVASDSFVDTLDVDNLNFEKGGFGPYKSYCYSKSCNILTSLRLSQMTAGTGVVVNSMNPGLVYTEIFDKSGGFFVGQFVRIFTPLLGKTEVQGAQTIIYLAAAEEAGTITGKFFEDCKISSTADVLLQNDGLAKKVWEASESQVNLQSSERHF